jgi:hypothetical protein
MIATVAASSATSAFDDAGGLTSIPRYDKPDVDVLVEYGLNDRLTLVLLQSGLQHISIAEPVDAARTGPDYTEPGMIC